MQIDRCPLRVVRGAAGREDKMRARRFELQGQGGVGMTLECRLEQQGRQHGDGCIAQERASAGTRGGRDRAAAIDRGVDHEERQAGQQGRRGHTRRSRDFTGTFRATGAVVVPRRRGEERASCKQRLGEAVVGTLAGRVDNELAVTQRSGRIGCRVRSKARKLRCGDDNDVAREDQFGVARGSLHRVRPFEEARLRHLCVVGDEGARGQLEILLVGEAKLDRRCNRCRG